MLELCCERAQLVDGQQVRQRGRRSGAAQLQLLRSGCGARIYACYAAVTAFCTGPLAPRRSPPLGAPLSRPTLTQPTAHPLLAAGAGAGVRLGLLEPLHGCQVSQVSHHSRVQQPHAARLHHGGGRVSCGWGAGCGLAAGCGLCPAAAVAAAAASQQQRRRRRQHSRSCSNRGAPLPLHPPGRPQPPPSRSPRACLLPAARLAALPSSSRLPLVPNPRSAPTPSAPYLPCPCTGRGA